MTIKQSYGMFAAIARESRAIPSNFQRKKSALKAVEAGAVPRPAQSYDDLSAAERTPPGSRTSVLRDRDAYLTDEELLPSAEQLVTVTVSAVSTKWSQVRDAALNNRLVSITNHQRPQLILMNIERYHSLRDRLARNTVAQPALEELNALFDAQFESFQTQEFKSSAKCMLEADGEFPEPTYRGPSR